jgi:hypothetical protein
MTYLNRIPYLSDLYRIGNVGIYKLGNLKLLFLGILLDIIFRDSFGYQNV